MNFWQVLTAVPSRWEPLSWLVVALLVVTVILLLRRYLYPDADLPELFVGFLGMMFGSVVLVLLVQWGLLALPETWPLGPFRTFKNLLTWGQQSMEKPISSEHLLLAQIAGVSILEEAVKMFFGLLLADHLVRGVVGDEARTLRGYSICLVLAGMAFGSGEALLYFRRYSAAVPPTPAEMFFLRSTALVLLHGSLTLLAFHMSRLDLVRQTGGSDAENFWRWLFRLIFAVLPVALLHGLYNTAGMVSDIERHLAEEARVRGLGDAVGKAARERQDFAQTVAAVVVVACIVAAYALLVRLRWYGPQPSATAPPPAPFALPPATSQP